MISARKTSADEARLSEIYRLDVSLIAELQVPLLGIAANAKVASSRLESGHYKKIDSYLKAIEFSSKNLASTVDILLRSHNPNNSSLRLNLEPVHLGLRIDEAVKKLVPLCSAQAQILDFRTNARFKNMVVSANQHYLDLVVYHVLEQALRSSASEEVLEVRLKKSAKSAVVQIRAVGCRQKASSLRKSIRRAVQHAHENTRQNLGSHFSLIASSKLLDIMGGNLAIIQTKGGINFNIKIPLSMQAELF